jgi:hypothetical protein
MKDERLRIKDERLRGKIHYIQFCGKIQVTKQSVKIVSPVYRKTIPFIKPCKGEIKFAI